MNTPDRKTSSVLIREKAHELGFDLFGIAPSTALKENGEVLREWCAKGMNAELNFLSRDIDKRIDPAKLFPGAKSVIATGLNYYNEKKQGSGGAPVIARYAYGKDYHVVIKERLDNLISYMKSILPENSARSYVDSSHILEKAWAARAGLGWQGRHSILVNRNIGSFFFLGMIITDAELEYDEPSPHDLCGSCRLCMDACPVSAINENRTIDARRCFAYLTIESKNPVDESILRKFEGRAYGCDICQEACPWNTHAKQTGVKEFFISGELQNMTKDEWLNMTKEDFRRLFGQSAISRRKYDIFIKNVTNVTKTLE
jgi:epoxyqueuosine reductase